MATHTEDFAARLRELKERSGRSYGMLAKRLHVSTSTLHRYCNGAAVPADYAPVERFARVCGATPEELVALHRAWLLADAERRGEGTAEAAPVEAAPVEESASEPAQAPAPRTPDPQPPAPPTADHTPQLAPVGDLLTSDTDRATAPGRRPRRLVLIAAAVAAVVAGSAGVAALASDGDPGPRTAASADPTAAENGVQPHGSASSRAATSPPPATPGPAPSTGRPGSPPPTKTPKKTGGPAPLHVNVLSNNWDSPCDQWFLMDKPPAEVPPPPTTQQAGAWASVLGGVPADRLRLQLTAQGDSAQTVVLHALYVHVVGKRPAPPGNVYTPGSGCGGMLEPASFAVDLEAAEPRPKPVAGMADDGSKVSSDFPYKISADEPQVLSVDAGSVSRDVSWYLELVWSSGDREGTIRIDDHGRPFRTIGVKDRPAYYYDGKTWGPSSVDDF
ncbi:helix-turn-helix domain-containing protein [Streptomyces polyrhachis]|uniref:Helix-turn-helix domain-containing protein n=1 Tax=Streptomyces polyrhachis TaxID=1282885 RepID=A0ABW2GFP1_9ACTN